MQRNPSPHPQPQDSQVTYSLQPQLITHATTPGPGLGPASGSSETRPRISNNYKPQSQHSGAPVRGPRFPPEPPTVLLFLSFMAAPPPPYSPSNLWVSDHIHPTPVHLAAGHIRHLVSIRVSHRCQHGRRWQRSEELANTQER